MVAGSGEAAGCYCHGARRYRRINPSTATKIAGQTSGNTVRRLDVGS